jgi:hypothetical protein
MLGTPDFDASRSTEALSSPVTRRGPELACYLTPVMGHSSLGLGAAVSRWPLFFRVVRTLSASITSAKTTSLLSDEGPRRQCPITSQAHLVCTFRVHTFAGTHCRTSVIVALPAGRPIVDPRYAGHA